MTPLRSLARPLLSSIFLVGGANALMDPEGHAAVAVDVTDPLQEASPTLNQASTVELVQLNGIAQLVGGLLLALGKLPRLAALLLAGTLVPTTLAAHRFWEEDDPDARQQQQVHFLKNVSLLGGLLIATTDRGGEPSLAWRAEHAVDHVKASAGHTADIARLKGELAKERAKQAASVDAKEHLRVRKELVKEQLTPDVLDAKRLVDAVRGDD